MIDVSRAYPDAQYQNELQELRDQISQMGDRVVNMIANSVRALVERDSELARRVIELDDQIDSSWRRTRSRWEFSRAASPSRPTCASSRPG